MVAAFMLPEAAPCPSAPACTLRAAASSDWDLAGQGSSSPHQLTVDQHSFQAAPELQTGQSELAARLARHAAAGQPQSWAPPEEKNADSATAAAARAGQGRLQGRGSWASVLEMEGGGCRRSLQDPGTQQQLPADMADPAPPPPPPPPSLPPSHQLLTCDNPGWPASLSVPLRPPPGSAVIPSAGSLSRSLLASGLLHLASANSLTGPLPCLDAAPPPSQAAPGTGGAAWGGLGSRSTSPSRDLQAPPSPPKGGTQPPQPTRVTQPEPGQPPPAPPADLGWSSHPQGQL
ncbi:hypothetical protein V8C86DRAFT_3214519 [Haematococcus lacustris]